MTEKSGHVTDLNPSGDNSHPTNKYSRRVVLVLWIIFAALIGYQAVGVFPFTPMNGNAAGIVKGVEMASHGGSFYNGYRYVVQPGTYWILYFLARLLQADVYNLFAALSTICSLGFVIFSALLVSRITGLPTPACALIILLFPEAGAGSYYPNSKAMAAFFATLALYVTSRTRNMYVLFLSGCVLGFAAFIRYSLLLVAPSSLFLLHRGNWKDTIYRTTILAFSTVLVATCAMLLCGVRPADIVCEIQIHGQSASLVGGITPWFDLSIYTCFFGIFLPILMIMGLFLIIKHRQWRLLGIFTFGICGWVYFYYGKVHSPKYMYALIPFFALPIAYFAEHLVEMYERGSSHKFCLVTSLIAIGFFLQFFVGVRIYRPSWAPLPTVAELFSTTVGGRFPRGKIDVPQVVIGAGQIIATGDLHRIASGWFFLPLTWHRWKQSTQVHQENFLKQINESSENLIILTEGWDRQNVLQLLLFRLKFAPMPSGWPESGIMCWTKASRNLYLVLLPDGGAPLPIWFVPTNMPDILF
jgi:hypothetical protein